jgi:predicted RNA polymerase sigma factor
VSWWPLAEQDRSRWDRALVDEGVALLMAALPKGRIGPYQLQAAIAGVHDEAASVDDTDWVEILGLYDLLQRIDPGPVVALNRAVALGMVEGPEAGLAAVDRLVADGRLAGHHRLHVVRAHLLERAGDLDGARAELDEAMRRTTSTPERRHLERRARELG